MTLFRLLHRLVLLPWLLTLLLPHLQPLQQKLDVATKAYARSLCTPSQNARDRINQSNPLLHENRPAMDRALSFFGRVKASYSHSTSFVDFFGRFANIAFETIGWILILLALALPTSMIAMGTVYLHECPREHYIPIYLIVGGCFGVVKNVLNLIQSLMTKCGRKVRDDPGVKTNPLAVVLSWFLLAWFITGSVWIYKIYHDFDDTDSTSARYCHPTLYLYSFWITTIAYAFTALACFGFCAITSLVLSFDSEATKASLMNCFGNVMWILYWYFTRYEAVAWPGCKFNGGQRQRLGFGEGDAIPA